MELLAVFMEVFGEFVLEVLAKALPKLLAATASGAGYLARTLFGW